MKTIRVVYGTTANKFWGVCGLIMHSAICSASQKTMPYKGIVRSKLTAISKVVNVQSEGKSITLMARLNDARLTKFLSHSRNVKIKQSNLTGFFTLNPSHAQSVVGVAGLLKGKLAYFGISVSKNNVFSPNFHLSLSMKRKKLCLSGMLKRMALREQENSENLDVNSNVEKIFDSDEVTDTGQRRVKSTTACPKQCSGEGFTENHNVPFNFADVYSLVNVEDLYSQINNSENILTEVREEAHKLISSYPINADALAEMANINEAMLITDCDAYSEHNHDLAIKNLTKIMEEGAKNRDFFHTHQIPINNVSKKLKNELALYEEQSMQLCGIHSRGSTRLKESNKMIISRILPIVSQLQKEFVQIKNYIENSLIPSYRNTYSHFDGLVFNTQVSIIEKIFRSQFKKRLQPFCQEEQQKIKQLENTALLSKHVSELSNQLLTLEDPKNNPSLLEGQFPGYLKILDVIVNTHLNQENMESLKNALSIKNSKDLLILGNFLRRIEAFCGVASDSIFFGNVIVLKTIVKAGEEFKETIKHQCEALLDCVSSEKELAILVQNAQEMYQTSLLEPLTPLAPPPWEIFERISPEMQPHLIEREVNVEDDSEIVNSAIIEGVKIDHLNSREDLSSRLDTKESGGSENFENRQT